MGNYTYALALIFTVVTLMLTGCVGSTVEQSSEESQEVREVALPLYETSYEPRETEKDNTEMISEVCRMTQAIDFSVVDPDYNLTPDVERLYKEAYLKILKSEIPTKEVGYARGGGHNSEVIYFNDLYKIEKDYEKLASADYINYYYDDLDGDDLPELGVVGGYTYILKYKLGEDAFSVIYCDESQYFKIMGERQIYYHDGLHANVVRDGIKILNDEGYWEFLIKLERSSLLKEQIDSGVQQFFRVSIGEYSNVDVGENNWNEITGPLFEAAENSIPTYCFEEVLEKMTSNSEE